MNFGSSIDYIIFSNETPCFDTGSQTEVRGLGMQSAYHYIMHSCDYIHRLLQQICYYVVYLETPCRWVYRLWYSKLSVISAILT